MYTNDFTVLKSWYDQQKGNNYVFDFKKELLTDYCVGRSYFIKGTGLSQVSKIILGKDRNDVDPQSEVRL